MQRYYLHLPECRAEALRLTQMEVLASVGQTLPDIADRGAGRLDEAPAGIAPGSLAHPRAWAGFQLLGQWR